MCGLAASITREMTLSNIDVTRISLADYQLPLYDAAIEARAVPEAAHELKRMINAHHGVIVVSPEYNASVSPLVKNAIDWVSAGARSAATRPCPCFAGALSRWARPRTGVSAACAGFWRCVRFWKSAAARW